jgi:hypothetical protein
MEKKLSRIIAPSQAMSEYPEMMLTTFDQRLPSNLSLVVIDGFLIGLDRKELDQKRQRFRNLNKKSKNSHCSEFGQAI